MAACVLSDVDIWDGHIHRGRGTIEWEGDRILAVRTGRLDDASVDLAPSDADGFSVIPGLIDTHVHLGAYAGDPPLAWDSQWNLVTPDVEKVFHIAANAQKAMRAGVTTLRDLAGDQRQLAVSRVFDDGIQVGPRLLVHGQVGMTAGHGDLFIPPHYPHRDPVADSPDECRRLVRQWAREGADGIKLYLSGGVLSMGDRVGWRNQTLPEIRAAVDEAHALGMRVAAHAHDERAARISLEEGIDSIEHGTGLSEKYWAAAIERNVPVAPTLLINNRLADGTIAVRPEAQAKARGVVAERDANFTGAAAAGVRFVLGTDANGVMVGFGEEIDEVHLMRRAFSWTSERTLRAATSDAADAIGLGETVGTLAGGYGADFLVVRGRPWEDVDALTPDSITAVVSRGRVVAGRLPSE